MMFVMNICSSILFVNTSVKIGVYLISLVIVSIISDLYKVPETFMADSDNLLNQYFIKLGWGWTLTFTSTYILLTTTVYCCRDVAKMSQHLIRVLIGTFWWYVCTTLFIHVGNTVGVCSEPQFVNKSTCIKAGKSWSGFDISGHIFLEMHCLLIILEEVKTFKEWKKLGDILLQDHEDEIENIQLQDRHLTQEDLLQQQIDYKKLTPFIKLLVICITIMLLLFELMLFISTIYRFHTLFQKIFASLVAVVCWFLSYRVLFRSGSTYPFMPVLPGHSCLQFFNLN